MTDFYYNFNVTGNGVSNSAYLWVQFTSGALQTGAAILYPTSAATTYVTFANGYAQQFPPGAFNAAMVVTSSGSVAGTINISPTVNVDITGTLYGIGGQTLGTVTLKSGQSSAPFNFPVSGGSASADEAAKAVADAVPKP